MEKYKNALIGNASKLDVLLESNGEILKLTLEIVDHESNTATIALLKKIADILSVDDVRIEIKHLAQVVNTNLVEYYGYIALQNICKTNVNISADARTLDDLISELNDLVGLEEVKSKVNDLIVYQKVQKLRRENNLHSTKNTLHLAFTGNPGTGKTTVARIVGHIYKQIGLLSKGHFIEVSRTDLIAGYQGQTALKVKNVIERAKGGVLFIDEAYSITENDHSDSYGRECLTELTKALEDYRDDLVVIVAGYTEPMEKFFESNPGLKSRFNTFIEFPDYNADELKLILLNMCKTNDYIISFEAQRLIEKHLIECVNSKDENFSNGRLIRNLYDDLVMNHARRVANLNNLAKDDLSIITEKDVVVPRTP